MDRVWKHFLLTSMIAMAVAASAGEACGMVVMLEEVSDGLPSSHRDTYFSLPGTLTGSLANSARTTTAISPVLSFEGTAPAPPARERLSNVLDSIGIPSGMVPSGESLSQAGGSWIGAAVFVGHAILPDEPLKSVIGPDSRQRAPAGAAFRLFRPPRIWS